MPADFAKALGFNLADSLASDLQLLANFFQGARAAVRQPKAQFQDRSLSRGQGREHRAEVILEQLEAGDARRVFRGGIFNKICQAGLFALAASRCL